jgi:hypothetical protein
MKILCATDLLPESDAAVERAAIVARQLRAQFHIVHIVGSVQDERKAYTALVQIGTRFGCSMEGDGVAPSVLLRVAVCSASDRRPAMTGARTMNPPASRPRSALISRAVAVGSGTQAVQ